ncbi:hypothetical protein [Rhizobium sp. Rhizsp82]|uniref:hypothetical protein n=1 Tax=Rhizobium sp. Rhizsp82 TaxID=3243057 RepID=UPI0039B59931
MTGASPEYRWLLDVVDTLDTAIALNRALIMASGNIGFVTKSGGEALGAVAMELHEKLASIHADLEEKMEGDSE